MYKLAHGPMVAILGWRARTANGQVFDSRTTDFADLPDNQLIALCLYLDSMSSPGMRHRHVYSGGLDEQGNPSIFFYDPQADTEGRHPVYGRTHDNSVVLLASRPNAIIKRASNISTNARERINAKNAAYADRAF